MGGQLSSASKGHSSSSSNGLLPNEQEEEEEEDRSTRRCVVYYDSYSDFFGRIVSHGSPKSHWFLGTVLSSSSSSSDTKKQQQQQTNDALLLTVRFDERQVESDLPRENVRWVTTVPANGPPRYLQLLDSPVFPGASAIVHSSDQNSSTLFANVFGNLQPTHLQLGDLVQVLFQKGRHDAWYRGRVGQVQNTTLRTHSSQQRVDICYDDGDVERNVPLHSGANDDEKEPYIILLERGAVNRSWLHQCPVPLADLAPRFRKRHAFTMGTVVIEENEKETKGETDPQQKVIVSYQLPREPVPQQEAFDYDAVVAAVFSYEIHRSKHCKQRHALLDWPASDEEEEADEKAVVQTTKPKRIVATQKKKKKTPAAPKTQPRPPPPQRQTKRGTQASGVYKTTPKGSGTSSSEDSLDEDYGGAAPNQSHDDDDENSEDSIIAIEDSPENMSEEEEEDAVIALDNDSEESILPEDSLDDDDDDEDDSEEASILLPRRTSPRRVKESPLAPLRRSSPRRVKESPAALRSRAAEESPARALRPRAMQPSYNEMDDGDDDDDDDDPSLLLPAYPRRTPATMAIPQHNLFEPVAPPPTRVRPPRPKRPQYDDDDDDDDDDDSTSDVDTLSSGERVTRSSRSTRATATTRNKGGRSAVIKKKKNPSEGVTNVKTAPTSKRIKVSKEDAAIILETQWDWQDQLDAVLPGPDSPPSYKTMDLSLSNPLGKALVSSDAMVAADLLTFMASMHGRLPNDALWQVLLELNALGPRSEGLAYPDTYKMNAVLSYLQCVLAKPGALDICCQHLDGKKFGASQKNGGAATYVEIFCEQMMADYYMESGDVQEASTVAMQRILNTLHAKVCFAKVFVIILQHQLKSIVLKDHLSNGGQSASAFCPDLHNLPIIRDILNSRRGAKDSLENVTKACATLWIQFSEPFLYGSHVHELSNFIGQEVLHLSELLGIVLGYFAWLYGREMNEDSFALADIIGHIFERELEAFKIPHRSSDNEWMHDSIKLRFISTIQKEIAPQLRPRLAERFRIVGHYNSLYGY